MTDLVIDQKKMSDRQTLDIYAGITFLFIFVQYIPGIPPTIYRMVMYSAICALLLKTMLFIKIKLHLYIVWYVSMISLGLVSAIYAVSAPIAFAIVREMIIMLVLVLFFLQFCDSIPKIICLFKYIGIVGVILSLFLLVFRRDEIESTRLGTESFGNANILGAIILNVVIVLTWLTFYKSKKYLLLNASATVLAYFVSLLTGGRKATFMPLIFLFVLLMIKNQGAVKKIGIITAIAIATGLLFFLVFTTPILYNVVGSRIEGLFAFISGNTSQSDASTIIRADMIEFGWELFKTKPILGIGLSNFQILYGIKGNYLIEQYSHNNYIELLTGLGLIGFCVYYAYILYMIYYMSIKVKDSETGLREFFLAYFVTYLFFDTGAVSYYHFNLHLFLGLASVYVYHHNREKTIRPVFGK
jgi:O-antigen ligase